MTPLKKYLIILFFCSLIVFGLSPYLDQQYAIIPFDFNTNHFYGEVSLWCKVVYYGVSVSTVLLIIVPLLILIRKRKSSALQRNAVRRMVLISYLSLALGPGLLVNTLFKDNWGRARPYQVIRDHHPFSFPWQPHLGRPKDNSFPSGHVSIGAFIGVPFIAARRRKLGITLCGIGFVVVGIVRFLQGGHYISDIFMAAILVWAVNILVTKLVDKYLMNKQVS